MSPVDLAQGAVELRALLALLTDLRAIVLSGQKAQAGWDAYLDLAIGDCYRVLRTVHPAGQSFAQAGAKEHFVATLTKAATFVDQPGSRPDVRRCPEETPASAPAPLPDRSGGEP